MLAKFWRGSNDGERKIHWMSWERSSQGKSEGGLGFRGVQDFNSRLLGKQYWRLMQSGESLFERFSKDTTPSVVSLRPLWDLSLIMISATL